LVVRIKRGRNALQSISQTRTSNQPCQHSLRKASLSFQTTIKMFKYVIVVLALIAAVLAAPRPQVLYTPSAYTAYNGYAAPAATFYSSSPYISTAYSNYVPAAATYSGYAPLTYL
uniref:Uncharacterized protein n=1 Tax=Anopheles atroparvus TaxID=41427 RepID=A0A182J6U8_ANOAO